MATNPLIPHQLPTLTAPAEQQKATADRFFHPLGALLFHSLPQFLLLCLWGWMLLTQQAFLATDAIMYYYTTFIVLAILWVGNLGYALYSLQQGKKLALTWIFISFACYLLGLVTYYMHMDQFIAHGVPNWQKPLDVLHYTGSFIVPAMLHQLSLVALRMHYRRQAAPAWRSLLLALLPPVLCYLMIMGAVSLRLPVEFEEYWFILLLSCATVVSVFYLVLGAVKLSHRSVSSNTRTILLLLLTAIFPLVCLLLNNGIFFGNTRGEMGIFGDFNHPIFYLLAILNGVLISLPIENLGIRKWAFLGRCITLPFSLYFFIVIAPFMPFAVFLVFAFGLGLLLLAPIPVLGFHLKALRQDITALRQLYKPATLFTAAAFAFMVLPIGIYLTYQHDRVVLHNALDYLQDPTATHADVSEYSLRRTILNVKGNQKRRDNWTETYRTPLLSPWFTWQVLDGLSLSDKKAQEIESVFLGESLQQEEFQFSQWSRPASGAVGITSLTGSSRYNAEAGHWVSEVHLEMNNPTDRWQEYITRFQLPAGCFISDYYLYIGERKEPGLLVEKKAATWVYDQITSQRKDPGLLRYLDNGTLELRVYPFVGKQSRRTGFTLLHKRPFNLQLDDEQIQLGDPAAAPLPQLSQNKTGMFIPKEVKQQLPLIERNGYWHIIIDVSSGKEKLLHTHLKALNVLLRQYPGLAHNAKVSFVGHSVSTYTLKDIDVKAQWKKQSYSGGFYLERALQSLYAQHAESGEKTYPVPLIITDDYDKAILPATLLQYAFAFPQTEQFYRLGKGGKLYSYSQAYPKMEAASFKIPPSSTQARVWPNAKNSKLFLPDNDKDELVPLLTSAAHMSQNNSEWDKGFQLWSNWQATQLYPNQQAWVEQVKASFASHILSPYTAFMVVEEEWQKEMLMRKQEQYLNGHPALDSNSELQEMPEPEFWVLLVIFLAWLGWRKRKMLASHLQSA